MGRAREGLQELDRAVALNPAFAAAQLNRAWALENLGDLDAAESAYRRVLEIEPASARALGSLAWLAARRADWSEALRRADASLALSPDPAARLARGLALLRQDDPAAGEREIRVLLGQEGLPPFERSTALWLLGEALDAQDRPAEAMSAYQQSNGALAGAYGPVLGAGQGDAAAFVDRLATRFEGMAPKSWPGAAGLTSEAPAFVLGFPCSGVEVVGRLLASHSKVATLEGQGFLARPTAVYLEAPGGLDRLEHAGPEELQPFIEELWAAAADAAGGDLSGRLPVQSLPLNTLALPLIARLIPDAKAVMVVRDPRDVVLSCFRQPFAPSRTNAEFLDIQRAAGFYAAVMRFADAAEIALDLKIHRLRYEDLVQSQEATMRALCRFLGLRWSASLAAPPDLQGETPGRWRAHAAALEPVLPILAPWIDRFGYDHG